MELLWMKGFVWALYLCRWCVYVCFSDLLSVCIFSSWSSTWSLLSHFKKNIETIRPSLRFSGCFCHLFLFCSKANTFLRGSSDGLHLCLTISSLPVPPSSWNMRSILLYFLKTAFPRVFFAKTLLLSRAPGRQCFPHVTPMTGPSAFCTPCC